ncbi:MAG: sulfotransferase [Halioglobus sp.]|nr:sulfotransferase [Halioglobus sp.]
MAESNDRAAPPADDISKARSAKLHDALTRKSYDEALVLLEEIVKTDPNAIEVQLIRAHLQALKGRLSLNGYRNIIETTLLRLTMPNLLTPAAGGKLLRGIQYACSGEQRPRLIRELFCRTEEAMKTSTQNLEILKADLHLALDDYNGFIQAVEQISQLETVPKEFPALERIARKFSNGDTHNTNAFKVFGIGLSRTGTSSLNAALRRIGYDAIHWLNPRTRRVVSAIDFPLFDAFSDITVSYQFEVLCERYPNAMFVETYRDCNAWVESMEAHYRNSRGIQSPLDLDNADIAQRFSGLAHLAERNLYIAHGSWQAAHRHFENRVNSFFSGERRSRLLRLHVADGEGWGPLCRFLDKDIPKEPFPSKNMRAEVRGELSHDGSFLQTGQDE